MIRRDFVRFMSSAVVLGGAPAFLRDLRFRGRPNVVLIITDDLGYGDLSITGRTDYRTPVIDQFGRDGIFLKQAYSSAPVCTPTRVALNTGRYPARYVAGLYEPLTRQKLGLSPKPATFARIMKDAGYETALVGKWHLGTDREFHPLGHGYDEFFGVLGPGADYISHVDIERRDTSFFQDGRKLIKQEGYLTDLFSARADTIIRRRRSKPLFLNVEYNAPHWPWQAPGDLPYPDTMKMSDGGSLEVYAKMMKSLDNGVARILDAVHASGAERDTLVIFTSDNGGERFSHMGPFSTSKMRVYEGGTRVAAFARFPGMIKAGTSTDQVCSTFDWTATITKIAGGNAPDAAPFDGIDIMPQLRGGQAHDRDLFWRVTQRLQQKAIRSGHWKYIVDEKGHHLFNLDSDPSEKTDVADANPAVTRTLQTKLAAWEAKMLKPIPLNPSEA